MSWLKSIVRPKIATRQRREMPGHLWEKCPSCGEMLYHKDLLANLRVCGSCQHHLRLPLSERLTHLVDTDSFAPIDLPEVAVDPLKFKDRKRYTDRLRDAQKKTQEPDAIRVGHCRIQGEAAVLMLLDFGFMGGSMGMAVGEAIVAGCEAAVAAGEPVVMVAASGGARMQEGILSLMQMARTSAALLQVKEAGLPYIVLLTDPTTGGVTASFAMQGDFTFAEPGALIGFAGPRVIQQTIGETLPEDFQTAEYLYAHGMLDAVLHRTTQPTHLATLLRHLRTAKNA